MQRVIHVTSVKLPEIRELHRDQPFQWLAMGWHDLIRNPLHSLAYGAMYALGFAGLTLLALYTGWYDIAIAIASGFAVIGPVLAMRFYEISRRAEQGEVMDWSEVPQAWRRNSGQVLGMGLILMLILLGWVRLVTLGYALLFQEPVASWAAFADTLFSPAGLPLLAAFVVSGFVVVAVVFAFTAVSLPMLLDHPELDAISAALISYEAVRDNLAVMGLWAFLIAALTVVGIATFYLGLVVIFPLLGHASWHAYRAAVGD